MNVYVKTEESIIRNNDIKWYLVDEALWITVFENYEDIERNIGNSYGSFNWLYNVNDTILFEKQNGKFVLAIINLTGKIKVLDNLVNLEVEKKRGDLFLVNKEHYDFEFKNAVCYAYKTDCLYSCPQHINKNIIQLSITEDFSFLIYDDFLVGWWLKNASRHLVVADKYEIKIDEKTEILAHYLEALKIWEQDESNREMLMALLETVQEKGDIISLAIKECLDNILSF